MKLSEAMMLGSATCKMIGGDWNSCALGSAGNALGVEMAFKRGASCFQTCLDGEPRSAKIKRLFPWLLDPARKFRRADGFDSPCEASEAIWSRFDILVCEGRMTFEQLVDYVRSIEPDCGECNRFECTCQKEVASEHHSLSAAVTRD